MKTLTGVEPDRYYVIDGIGGSIDNGTEQRAWYEPEAQAIQYIKFKVFDFYVLESGIRSSVIVRVVKGKERLATSTDTPTVNTLALLRMCDTPVEDPDPSKSEQSTGLSSVIHNPRAINGFFRLYPRRRVS